MKKLCLLLVLCLLFSGCVTKPAEKAPNCDAGHTDAAGDGFCDVCSALLLVFVDFYNLNDIHGKLDDAGTHPGLDELSSYLEASRQEDNHAIFLSSGDMWQGASESNLTQGHIMTDWMNEMGFAAMAMGNHEYDWGEAPILTNEELSQFPFLAINIYDRETGKQVSYCESSTVVDLGQIQIGIIGAIGDCYSSIAADKVEDVYFLTGSDLTGLVKAESQKLRNEGADYIVYLLHDGNGSSKSGTVTNSQLQSYYDPSLSQGYIDLVFEGHTHQKYVLKDAYGVYHLQGGGDNQGITHVEIAYNTVTGKGTVQTAELVPTEKYTHYEDHPVVDALLEKYDDQVSKGNEALGTNAASRNGRYVCQLAADLYYEKGVELWGDTYDIALGGGFFQLRSPGYLSAGEITYKMLYSILPFDNHLVLCSIKGKDLQSRFFHTSNDRYYLGYGDYGKKLKNDLDPDGTYYVVVDSYTSQYAPNRLTEVARCEEDLFARDLLAEYIRSGGLQ